MTLRGIASAFGTVILIASIGVGIGILQRNFAWSDTEMSRVYFGISAAVVLVLTYSMRNFALATAVPVARDKSPELAPLHYFGLFIIAIGGILMMSNITGVYKTFPYAGQLVALAGIMLNMLAKPQNARSIFDVPKTPYPNGAKPLATVLGLSALASLALLSVVGAFIDIILSTLIPSGLSVAVGIAGGSIIAIFFVVSSERFGKQNRTLIKPSNAYQKALQIVWVRIPVLIAMGFGVGISAFGLGYPYVYTHFWGMPSFKTDIVSGWHNGVRRCSKPELEHKPFMIGEQALCVAKDARLSMPVGTSVMLVGRESIFGLNVNEIRVITGTRSDTNTINQNLTSSAGSI